MPHSTLGDERYVHTGYNEDGERVFRRYAPPPSSDGGYEDKSKAELQALLKHMGLPVSGTKEELIARLQDG